MDARRHLTPTPGHSTVPLHATLRAGRALTLAAGLAACSHGGPDLPAVEVIAPASPVVLAPILPDLRPAALVPPPDADRPAVQPPAARRRTAAAQAPASTTGRAALAAAGREARAASGDDVFIGGVRVFAWAPGRIYEVWTAPLRVTVLTLAPGETVTSKAAGDTVRWQIGESVSGPASGLRTHVLIKPLQTGLETNLVLTTSQRVYLLALKSGPAEAFHASVAWDTGSLETEPVPPSAPRPALADSAGSVAPIGPIDARYRIEARGRPPRWMPTAAFSDGLRTFITLSPEAATDEAPALFVRAGGELELVSYRQDGNLLVVDRLFDEAELRLGDRRPRVVVVRRLAERRP